MIKALTLERGANVKILYDTDKLNSLLKHIYTLTGVTVNFLDSEDKFLSSGYNPDSFCIQLYKDTAYRTACMECNRKLIEKMKKSGEASSHICHAGLYDAAIPITKDGVFVGTVMIGQLRTPHSPSVPPPDLSDRTLVRRYKKLPYLTFEQLDSLHALIREILFENAITVEHVDIIEKISDYIASNLGEMLTVEYLCSKFHISKNTLYRLFEKNFGMTVNKYVRKARISAAKKLILAKLPVYIIAEKVGIANVTYFCRLFKKETGFSPTEYRKKRTPHSSDAADKRISATTA